MCEHVYRICTTQDWAATEAEGRVPLSPLDRSDGFVHLSTAAQVAGTLRRYFARREDLMVLTVDCGGLLGKLLFEHARYDSDERFPHFYGAIPRAAVRRADPLALDADGHHRLPDALRRAIVEERDETGTVDLRVVWDPDAELALIDYPRPVHIVDEAGVHAWEAVIERRVGPLVERRGAKIPAVIGLDNLWVAAKLERRYAELVDKVVSRWFCTVARWTSRADNRSFFSRVNHARELPARVFDGLEQAVAHVQRTRADRVPASA